MKKTIIIILIALLAGGVIGAGGFFLLTQREADEPVPEKTDITPTDEEAEEVIEEEVIEKEEEEEEEEEELLSYKNTKHKFQFNYPKAWHMLEGDEQAEIIRLSSTEEISGDGGTPLGANTDIYVIENYDNLSLEDWLKELMEYGPELYILEKDTFEGKNISFVRQTYAPFPDLPEVVAGPVIASHALIENGAYVLQINYLGREPCYSEGIHHYENLLRSFELTN